MFSLISFLLDPDQEVNLDELQKASEKKEEEEGESDPIEKFKQTVANMCDPSRYMLETMPGGFVSKLIVGALVDRYCEFKNKIIQEILSE